MRRQQFRSPQIFGDAATREKCNLFLCFFRWPRSVKLALKTFAVFLVDKFINRYYSKHVGKYLFCLLAIRLSNICLDRWALQLVNGNSTLLQWIAHYDMLMNYISVQYTHFFFFLLYRYIGYIIWLCHYPKYVDFYELISNFDLTSKLQGRFEDILIKWQNVILCFLHFVLVNSNIYHFWGAF